MNRSEPKHDKREKRGGWAPGEYLCHCTQCRENYVGDKRSFICADCAYVVTPSAHACTYKTSIAGSNSDPAAHRAVWGLEVP